VTKIKFCGLRHASDASQAAALGATYGGVILTTSIRQVSVDQAREIFAEAPSLNRVGVVGRETVPRLLAMAREASLDVLQLHGSYTLDEFRELRLEYEGQIWAVIGMEIATGMPVQPWREVTDVTDAVVLDTSEEGVSGGTGKTFDWRAAAELVNEIKKDVPVVLAGGLKPGNVGRAIEELRPAVVDVSSGVESSPGVKSPDLMKAFAQAVLSASIV
jgi:phosphoribosylanthranilate isomerase